MCVCTASAASAESGGPAPQPCGHACSLSTVGPAVRSAKDAMKFYTVDESTSWVTGKTRSNVEMTVDQVKQLAKLQLALNEATKPYEWGALRDVGKLCVNTQKVSKFYVTFMVHGNSVLLHTPTPCETSSSKVVGTSVENKPVIKFGVPASHLLSGQATMDTVRHVPMCYSLLTEQLLKCTGLRVHAADVKQAVLQVARHEQNPSCCRDKMLTKLLNIEPQYDSQIPDQVVWRNLSADPFDPDRHLDFVLSHQYDHTDADPSLEELKAGHFNPAEHATADRHETLMQAVRMCVAVLAPEQAASGCVGKLSEHKPFEAHAEYFKTHLPTWAKGEYKQSREYLHQNAVDAVVAAMAGPCTLEKVVIVKQQVFAFCRVDVHALQQAAHQADNLVQAISAISTEKMDALTAVKHKLLRENLKKT